MFQRYSAGTTFHTRKRTWYKFRSGFDTEWQKNDPAPTGAGFELVLSVSAQDSVLLYGYRKHIHTQHQLIFGFLHNPHEQADSNLFDKSAGFRTFVILGKEQRKNV